MYSKAVWMYMILEAVSQQTTIKAQGLQKSMQNTIKWKNASKVLIDKIKRGFPKQRFAPLEN